MRASSHLRRSRKLGQQVAGNCASHLLCSHRSRWLHHLRSLQPRNASNSAGAATCGDLIAAVHEWPLRLASNFGSRSEAGYSGV